MNRVGLATLLFVGSGSSLGLGVDKGAKDKEPSIGLVGNGMDMLGMGSKSRVDLDHSARDRENERVGDTVFILDLSDDVTLTKGRRLFPTTTPTALLSLLPHDQDVVLGLYPGDLSTHLVIPDHPGCVFSLHNGMVWSKPDDAESIDVLGHPPLSLLNLFHACIIPIPDRRDGRHVFTGQSDERCVVCLLFGVVGGWGGWWWEG